MAQTIDIKVPDIGNFKDVSVIEVLVKPDDKIEKEQGLITLETDKATMDVPATEAGTVKALKVKQGDKVSEGAVVLTLEVAAAGAAGTQTGQAAVKSLASERAKPQAAASAPKASAISAVAPPRPPIQVPAPAPVAARGDAGGFSQAHAGPAVRKFARELGVDLARVTGSGRKGRITQEDVQAFVKSALQGGSVAGGGLPRVPEVDFAKFGAVEVKPLPRIKRISGPRLQAAWVNVPHVTQHDEADITNLESLRKSLKIDAEKIGAKLTLLAFLVKACVTALHEFPEANASLDPSGQNLVYKKYYHIGFAADTPNGLMVPVI
ncbi:MAG: 2-oxo acid dehydrogenase subunit E2, partial [Gammaproteobacteria bacterium]